MSSTLAGYTRKAAFILLLLAAWQAVVSLRIWPPLLVPSMASVAASLVDGFRTGTVPIAIAASMGRMLVGYFLAVAIGLPLGIAIARLKVVKDTLGAAAASLQSLPSVCWLPLALLWFGLTEKAIIFVVVMGATFSITMAVEDGIRNVPPILLKAGRTLGASGLQMQRSVVLPAALPTIVTGLKLGWSFAWRSLMAGELLYSEKGLGRVLMMGRDLGDMAQVVATIIVILIIGMLVNEYLFATVERSLARRWGLQGH